MSIRQNQVGELIRRHLSIVFQNEGSYIYGTHVMITITNVIVSSDLGLAKVYLSIFNTENKQEVILELEEAKSKLKQSLFKRIKSHLRRMPEIDFYIDETADEIIQIDSLFTRLKAENQMGKDEEE